MDSGGSDHGPPGEETDIEGPEVEGVVGPAPAPRNSGLSVGWKGRRLGGDSKVGRAANNGSGEYRVERNGGKGPLAMSWWSVGRKGRKSGGDGEVGRHRERRSWNGGKAAREVGVECRVEKKASGGNGEWWWRAALVDGERRVGARGGMKKRGGGGRGGGGREEGETEDVLTAATREFGRRPCALRLTGSMERALRELRPLWPETAPVEGRITSRSRDLNLDSAGRCQLNIRKLTLPTERLDTTI
ncbi:hypothetical protein B0H10DRAFT_1938452 [Mycena sp. CBHHK59/15]|nr:hypothetical protein B0H10DRAFT_1938452 [Mycena sp. CBHHK59/15]